MNEPAKLPLLKASMALLVDHLTARDLVAVVVYAGSAGLVLPPTPGDRKEEIRHALDRLEAGGSTSGGAGIELAYAVARKAFIEKGVNRVILATDGDFNVGITSPGGLVRLIEDKRRSGVFLSVLGFGTGNLKDSTMELLADKGNGNYAYIDSLEEGRKVLVTEASSTLVTVAKDVKIQVEFNPRSVAAYRLVGYENRVLAAEDFKDDGKDAGDIGAGHSVTALYEIVPAGADVDAGSVDPLRYQEPRVTAVAAAGGELATIKLRYKAPDGETSTPLQASVREEAGEASANLRFAASVAEFGMALRGSKHMGEASFSHALELGRGAIGEDRGGVRAEFLGLVEAAQRLSESKGHTAGNGRS
jgi:Ca-activated chloride channel family protein